MENIKKSLIYIFYAIFILLFGYIFINCLFNNNVNLFKCDSLIVCIGIIFFIVISLFLYRLINKIKKINTKLVLAVVFSFLIIVQIIFGISFKVKPNWDFGSVYDAAVDSATGNQAISDTTYFYQYSNNIGLAMILKIVYKIAYLIGIDSFLAIGIFINILCIDIALFFTYLVVKHLLGERKALFTLIIMGIMTPLFTYVPIFYTDTISMPFVIIPLYLDIIANKSENRKRQVLLYLLEGVILFIGMMLKFTVVIVLIALVVTKLLFSKKIKNILNIAYLAIPVILLFLLQNMVLSKLFDENKLNTEQFPYTHWVMMGLNDKGGYSEEDVQYTFKFESKKQKQDANIEVINERLKRYIQNGELINFYTNKLVYTWGDGTYFAPEKLRREPLNFGIYHEFILGSGKYVKPYYYFAQIEHMSVLLLILISAITAFSKKLLVDDKYKFCLTLSVFGLILFLLLWETRSRYIINFIPVFMILATFGIDKIYKIVKKEKMLKESENIDRNI